MAADEDLRAWCLADSAIGGVIGQRWHQNTVPAAGAPVPFIWARRQRVETDGALSEPRVATTWFELECVSQDLDEAMQLADLVRERCEGARGKLGMGLYQYVAVIDQYDDYQARNLDADEQLQIAALIVQMEHA